MNTDAHTQMHEALAKVPEVTLIFWIVKIAATTLGETGGDALSMSLNLGYLVSTGIFAAIFVAAVWAQIKATRFHPAVYWTTIIASTTVGTTLGDWTADTAGLGYTGGALVFSTLLALVVAAYFWTSISRTLLFWAAFVLTRPLGAVVGDFLDKPVAAGGLALDRFAASGVLLAFIVAMLVLFRQRVAAQAR